MPVVHAAAHNLAFSGDGHFRVILFNELLILLDFLHCFGVDMDRTTLIVRRFALISHLLTLIVNDGTCTIIDHQKW